MPTLAMLVSASNSAWYVTGCGSCWFHAAGARIGEFNGKNLSTVGSSMILVDDTAVPGVADMQQWFVSGGAAQPAQALSRTGGGRSDRRATASIIRDEVRC